jgi:hypothetical protein
MIVLYNPLSTTPGKQPLPLSLLSLAAVLESRSIPWTLVDGNLTADPAPAIIAQLSTGRLEATPHRGPRDRRARVARRVDRLALLAALRFRRLLRGPRRHRGTMAAG